MTWSSGSTRTVLGALSGRSFDAVLFDLDGTLIDSTPAVVRSWLTWAREEGIDPAFRDTTHGQPAMEIVKSLVSPERVQQSYDRIVELESNDTRGITALPGAASLLAAIPRDRVALVTSCTRQMASLRCSVAGLVPPDIVISADDVTKGKPDPEPFLMAAKVLGFPPERCLVLEDAPAGISAARAAGTAVLGVEGTHAAEYLQADGTLSILSEITINIVGGGLKIRKLPLNGAGR